MHLRGLGAMPGSPGQGYLAHPMDPWLEVAGRPLACPMAERGAKLALAGGSKQPQEGFASSCWAAPR